MVIVLNLLISFFVLISRGLNLNLSEVFRSLPIYDDTFNITLDEKNPSYYLDDTLEFKYDKFYIFGKKNIIYLLSKTKNSFFSFKNNRKTYFSGLSFVYAENSRINESLFCFENVESIFFEVNIYFFHFNN